MSRTLKTIISFSFIVVLMCEQLLFSVSYAATPQPVVSCSNYTPDCKKTSICATHSEEFQMYINFVIDMISTLKAISAKQELTEEKPNVGFFSNNVLTFPKKQLATLKFALKIGVDDFKKGFNALVAGFAIFFDIGKEALGDTLASFKVLFRVKPFVRDYGVLLDMEASLHDLMFELSVAGKYSKTLDAAGIASIQKVLTQYTTIQPLFSSAFLDSDTTYADVVRILFDLTSTMKIFISGWRSKPNQFLNKLERKENQFVTPSGDSLLLLQFNTNTICIMEKKYLCAAEQCSKSWNEIWKDLSNISILEKAVKESMTMIVKANKELVKALAQIKDNIKNRKKNKNNPNIGLTEYQQELLRTVYGMDTTKITKKQGIGLSDLFSPSDLKKSIKIKGALQVASVFEKENSTDQNTTKKSISAQKQAAIELQKQAQKNAQELQLQILQNNKYITPSLTLTSSLTAAMNDVIAAQEKTSDRMSFGETTSITRHYKEIGAFIQTAIDEYVGTKDTDGLVKNLGSACEKQCINKGNVGCYSTQ